MVDSDKWQLATQSEMMALHVNQMWDLVKFPKGEEALTCKWIYRHMLTPRDRKPKNKARLVVKGLKQE